MEIKQIGKNLKHHISIDALALQRFNHILNSKYALEFTAFTHCDRNSKTGEYRLYDAFFPKQVNTPVTTECESDDVMELIRDGADITKLSGHIHSHVDMGIQPSGTDEKDILERSEHSNYNAALILNKKGAFFGHIVDLDLGLYLQDVDIFINYPSDWNFDKEMLKIVKKASSMDEVKKISKIDEWDYFNEQNPLSKEQIQFLDNVITNRFKRYKTYETSLKKPQTINNAWTPQDNAEYLWDDTDFYLSESDTLIFRGYDSKKFKDEDAYVDYLMTTSESEMTTDEYMDYEYHILNYKY